MEYGAAKFTNVKGFTIFGLCLLLLSVFGYIEFEQLSRGKKLNIQWLSDYEWNVAIGPDFLNFRCADGTCKAIRVGYSWQFGHLKLSEFKMPSQ